MGKLINNYKFNIGDVVKIDTSLMNNKYIKICKFDGILNLEGVILTEDNIYGEIWEHEVDFGVKTKILTASFLQNVT